MKARLAASGALLLSVVTPATAHRLDEYLQATFVSVENGQVKLDMFLTPGVAVLPIVLADIDSDGNGVLSEAEQRAYGDRVLRDLSLTLNGERLASRLVSVQFPKIQEMKEGSGNIHLEVNAELPQYRSLRRLGLENHHQSGIAAYQVNSLVSRDPAIRIGAEHRNYLQSTYELEFTQATVRSDSLRSGSWLTAWSCLGTAAVLVVAWLGFRWRARAELC